MVSRRCKMYVIEELKKLGLYYISVNLGEINIAENISAQQREQIKTALGKAGLKLMDDKKAILIEHIKTIIINLVHYSDEEIKTNFSDYLSDKLSYNYNYLANLFSEAEGCTIEHFMITHKIEKVKELIMYDELNLTEIAFKLHYSSVAHLSNQFKKITGLTPSFFKNLKKKTQSKPRKSVNHIMLYPHCVKYLETELVNLYIRNTVVLNLHNYETIKYVSKSKYENRLYRIFKKVGRKFSRFTK